MDCYYDNIVPAKAHDASSVKNVLRQTPDMSAACMRVFLDIDEMIDVTCKEHARRYPYDPLVRVIQCRRWTTDKPGAVDLVAMHIDWRSDCRHMIAHTALHHCHRMLSRHDVGADCRAVLSAHVSKEDGDTKAWLQLYLEPAAESHIAAPPSSNAMPGDDDAMACETLPPPHEPLPIGTASSASSSAVPSSDVRPVCKAAERETTPQSVLKVLGLYPDLPVETRKTLTALVRSLGHLACEWVAGVGSSPLSTIVVPTRADIARVAQRIEDAIRLHGRVCLSASSQASSGGIVVAIAPMQGRAVRKDDNARGAAQTDATAHAHFILPKPEPVDADKTTTSAKVHVAENHAPPARSATRGDGALEPVKGASHRATVWPGQTPVDIVALYPTMTIQDAGYVFAAENQLAGVAHHWVIPTTLLAMRVKSVSVSLRAAPAAMARAVSEHGGLREGTKKVVLALCRDADETARVLCSIVDVLPGPEKQSPIQVAALYPHLALCEAISVGALEARLCSSPHVWVARWPNGFAPQRARITADMGQTLDTADLLCNGMAGHQNAWLVLSLERDEDGDDLWLCYSRASSQTAT